jgi:hypothetical protein
MIVGAHRRGAASEAEVEAAQRQLAAARYHVAEEEGNGEEMTHQLRLATQTCKKELDRTVGSYVRGAAPKAQVDEARYRLAFSRAVLAQAEGAPSERAEQIQLMIAVRQEALGRERQLYNRRSASQEAVDNAEIYYLKARLVRAFLERELRDAQQLLRRLVTLTEKRLQYLVRDPKPEEEEERAGLAWELALRRYQLTQVLSGDWYKFRDDPLELDGNGSFTHSL